MKIIKRFFLALSYVTALHLVTTEYDEGETQLYGLAKYLPAVGLLVGAILFALAHFLPWTALPLLPACLITLAWLWLTGGLHIDGLMDTADGIFSHQSKERILEIMRDSRVGNFGVLAGVSILLLKIAGIGSLKGRVLLLSLLLIPAWARWCELYAIGKFSYARDTGKGKVWHESTRYPLDLILGAFLPTAATAAAFALTDFKTTLTPVILTVLPGVIAAHWLKGKVGGQTGDTYGAVVELSEATGISLTALLFSL